MLAYVYRYIHRYIDTYISMLTCLSAHMINNNHMHLFFHLWSGNRESFSGGLRCFSPLARKTKRLAVHIHTPDCKRKRYYYTLHCSLFRLSVLIVEISFRVDVLHVMVFFQSAIAAGRYAVLQLFVYRSAILPAQAGLHVDFTSEEKH